MGSVIKKARGEDYTDIIARMELKHPELKRSVELKLTSEMRREAFARDASDRRKLGKDY